MTSNPDPPPTIDERPRQFPARDQREDRIGPYRLIEVLGEGGMGVVHLAEQTEPVERRVALKLMRSRFTDAGLEARFAAERQALARLSHPNIAQMYEAGTTAAGYPYFAMEHVDGSPLTSYCDERCLPIDGARVRVQPWP